MAVPTYVSSGSVSTSGAPGIPASTAADDVLLLFVMCSSTSAPTVSGGNQTWTECANSGTATGGGHTIRCYWARRGATSPTAPTVSGSQEMRSEILAFRGCHTSGDPWVDAPVADGSATSIALGSTTVDEVLVVVMGGADDGRTSGTWSGSNLASKTTRSFTDHSSFSGWVMTGTMATAGDCGTLSPDFSTDDPTAAFALKLMPPQPATTNVSVYNGSSWDLGVTKVYNGSTWDEGAVKVYNGSAWEP